MILPSPLTLCRALRQARRRAAAREVPVETESSPDAIALLRTIGEITPDLIAAQDKQFRYIYFNRPYQIESERLFGAKIEIGSSMLDAMTHLPEQQEKAAELWGRAQEEAFTTTLSLRDPAGEGKLFQFNFRPLFSSSGEKVGAVQVIRDLTQQDKIEEELWRRTETVRTLGEVMPHGVWWCNENGGAESASQCFLDLLQMTADEFREFGWASRLPPDEAEPLVKKWLHCVKTGEDWTGECQVLGPDGNYHAVLSRGKAVRDRTGAIMGWTGVNLDIDDRARAEASEERLKAFMNNNPSLVFLKDEAGRYVYLNDAYANQFVGSKDWYGKTDYDFWPKESAELFRQNDKDVLASGRTRQFLEDSTDMDGKRHCWLCYKFPFTDSRNQTYLGGIGIDATARVEAEEALKDRDQKKDQFLAMLAHELRNPMAAISAAGELLSRPGIDAEKTRIAREALKGRIRQLARLVDDLLDVSRMTRGNIELKRQNLDLEAVIALAAEAARGYFEEREQQLALSIAAPLPVHGDPVRLEQIVANLLTNASRYSENGQEVRLSAFRQGQEAVIRVEDNGMGIRPALLPRIFEPFIQAENSMARTRGGLGLGLSIVKSLSELHEGSVSAQSEGEGKGSCFEVRLPLTEVSAMPEPQKAALRAVDSLRILLVEDHPDTALMQATMLEMEGHTVDVAADGIEAVEKALSMRPDAILLDIGLPGLDGFSVAERVRKAGLTDTLIIALTGYGQEQDIIKGRKSGIDYHLLKPVNYENLLVLLRKAGTEGPAARGMQ